MNKPDSRKKLSERRKSRPLFSFWGFRLGCATLYWAAAFVVIMNALALYFNIQAGLPISTDRRPTWIMVGLLLMLAYHQLVGWWPFNKRTVNPEFERWAEARRQREAAERAAAAAEEQEDTVAGQDVAADIDATATYIDEDEEPPAGQRS